MSNLQLAHLLVTSPRQAFAELKQQPRFALPLWVLLIGTAAIYFWYYSIVDIEWLKDQMVSVAPNAEVRAQQEQALAMLSPALLKWISTISVILVLLVVNLVGAVYFLLAGNLTNVRYDFTHWFAFNWWVGTPQILGLIPAALILLLSGRTQLEPGTLQPLSLNELLFHRAMSEPGYNLLTSLGLLHILIWWLTIVGLRVWSGRSMLYCVVVALLPSVLIYGIWALVAFR